MSFLKILEIVFYKFYSFYRFYRIQLEKTRMDPKDFSVLFRWLQISFRRTVIVLHPRLSQLDPPLSCPMTRLSARCVLSKQLTLRWQFWSFYMNLLELAESGRNSCHEKLDYHLATFTTYPNKESGITPLICSHWRDFWSYCMLLTATNEAYYTEVLSKK